MRLTDLSLPRFALDGQPEPAPAPAPASAPTASQPVREAVGVTIDADEAGWRRLSGRADRDLPSTSQAQMRKMAAFLWETNLLANRLVELPLAYLLAEGVRLTCDDEEHQAWLDEFWRDPINNMDIKLVAYARELSLFGELCLPAFVNPVTGLVRIGYLDPNLIEDVITDPGNPGQDIGVRTVADAQGRVFKYRTLLRGEDEELFAPAAVALRTTMTDGGCFYFGVNRFAAGARGRSDLLAQFDWLDGYDEWMFEQLERANDQDPYIWDVTLNGASAEDVKQRAKELTRPPRGSVRVHNDQEAWTAVSPELNSVDKAEAARMFRNHSLGGATVPEHWFGGGGDVNRAVGGEMGEPFFKLATMRQSALRHILVEIGSHVLWRKAQAAGQKPDWADPTWRVSAVFPEMVTRDITKIAAAMQSCVAAVSGALAERLITRATALRIIAVAARRLEVDIDPEDELAKAEAENPGFGNDDELRGGPGVPTGLDPGADDGSGSPTDPPAPPEPRA